VRRSKEWGSIGFKLRSDRWVLVEYMEVKCARDGEAFYVESMLRQSAYENKLSEEESVHGIGLSFMWPS